MHFVNLQLLGRGSAEGWVKYDNGEVAELTVVLAVP